MSNSRTRATAAPWHRCLGVALAALALGGCGGIDSIRGQLTYDLRAPGARSLVVWPPKADVPRYRYIGELVGQSNFVDQREKSRNPVIVTLEWVAGVNEKSRNELTLERPQHGTVSDKGRVYVVDAGRNAIVVFDPNAAQAEESERGTGLMSIWPLADARTRFQGPVAVTTVWGGDIAVSDAALGFVARLDDAGVPTGKIGAEHLLRPTGLAFDPARGLLYVADTVDNNIKVYDEAGRRVRTIGAAGEGPGQFNAPTHLAFADGKLYVSDTLNSRVQVLDAEGRHLRSFGQRGLYVGHLTRPKGIAVGDGVVYVVESYYGHLLTYGAGGEFLMGINGSGLDKGEFLLPSGVWTDKQGRVFVADMFNRRVVVFQFLGHDEK